MLLQNKTERREGDGWSRRLHEASVLMAVNALIRREIRDRVFAATQLWNASAPLGDRYALSSQHTTR